MNGTIMFVFFFRVNMLIRIQPWIRVNGSLNRRVLDKWMGTLLMYCISHTGSTIMKIATRFNVLQPTQVRILLEVCILIIIHSLIIN